MKVPGSLKRIIRFTKSLVVTGAVSTLCAAALTQANATTRQAICSSNRAAIAQWSASLGQVDLWDDARIARARASLAKLQASRTTLIRLTRRLSGAEWSAVNAGAFDKSAEANFWTRDANEIRAAIATEKKKAKGFAADAGISCPGCTYSVLISKVETAIKAAVYARTRASEVQRQIANYRASMAAAGC